jgi:uncharacterized protein
MGRGWKTVLVILLIVVLLSIAILAAIPPLIIGDMVNQHVTFAQVWTGQEYGLEPTRLELTTDDGLRVVAYEVQAEQPRAVVIFLSGIHNPSVTAFFGHARMLLDQGYASILLEMRAHGESEGDTIALGYKEHLDVRAVVDHIASDARYQDVPIIVYGVSMGGATAINATGMMPEINGLISLSAYSAWDEVFVDNMGVGEPLASLQRPFVRLYTTIKYGWANRHVTPRNQIQNLGDRPALLVHSRQDSQVPYASIQRLVAQAPPHVETWVREGDLHLIVREGNFLEPEQDTEYTERILGFLERHFGE